MQIIITNLYVYFTNFQVAGTIVTYELILLQFNKADKVNDCYEH